MRSLLVFLLVILTFPIGASSVVIEPGSFSVVAEDFTFHSKENTLYVDSGMLSYGRLDLNPLSHMLYSPHSSSFSLGIDARDSVKKGVRGMVFDSEFFDFSIGMGRTPEFSAGIEYGNLSLSFDFKHRNARRRRPATRWERVLEMDVLTFGFEAKGDYGLKVISLFSLSPETSTKVFTGISMDTGNIEMKIGRGTTLLSRKDTEISHYLKVKNGYGSIYISDECGFKSFKPSSYTETRRELGYVLDLGKVEFGSSTKVFFSKEGKWKSSRKRFLDFGIARFSWTDGAMRFSMKPVEGFSISVGSGNTSISFKYKGMEVKRNYDGSWSFRVSIEPT